MIFTIAAKELKSLFGSPLAWIILGVLQVIFAYLFLSQIDAFLDVQPKLAQLANPPGVTEIVAAPLFASAALFLLMAVPLFSMRLIAEERRNQTLTLLLSAPLSMPEIVLGKFVGLMSFLGMIAGLIFCMAASLRAGGALDWGLLGANLAGLLLLFASFAALGLFVSSLTRQPMLAAVGCLGALLLLWLMSLAPSDSASALQYLSLLKHFEGFNRGLIDTADITYFVLFSTMFLVFAIRRLDAISKKFSMQLLALNVVFAVLFVTLLGLIAFLSRDYHAQWDVTFNSRNSLSQGSLDTLKRLRGPVSVTAYATRQDPQLGDIRKLIADFYVPYQRAKKDIRLNFIDPSEQPRLTREAGVQTNGEMVVEYAKRSEHLTALNEQAFINVLMRLARDKERLVMYLDGHGERKLDGMANHDLGDFGRQLSAKGFSVASLNLALAQEVPHNISLLVIASPQMDLQPDEIGKLLQYLKRGGNLLWLIDQEPLHGLQPLAEKLGLILTPGIVVDPAAQQRNASPAMALGAVYARHAVTQNFNLITVFPFARQVGATESKEWHTTPLIEVAPRGWVETGKLDGTISFDKTREVHGPVNIGLALERDADDRQQRIVVIGSGAFLSNTYVGNGGNLDLGVNAVNWLAGDDTLISIQPRATVDSSLHLDKIAAALISVGFLIVLPLAFAAMGGFIWWRRRKL